MKWIIYLLLIIAWLYALWVLKRSDLPFWRFLVGALGLFLILMLMVRPYIIEPLARLVAVLAGGVGKLTGTFSAFFKYGILFINSKSGAITLQIDFECSGVIEIIAYISLLAFFDVYKLNEKVIVGILGTAAIIFANALRIVVICEIIHFGGMDMYYIAHTIIGRLVFYALSVVLYFYVFTKPQIIRTKVGKFTYGHN